MPDIDSTPGGDSSNSYLDLDEALERADERVGATSWLNLDEDDQARTLITATRAIDSLDLLGDPSSEDQTLHFPVDGSDLIPSKIEQATLELALSYAAYYSAVSAGGDAVDPLNPAPSNIKEDTVGPITTVFFSPEEMNAEDVSLASFPKSVQRLLADFVRTTASNLWGSSIAVRAS